ncbi:MAG: ATP-dependent Clp protease ATP-binding subunit, partial [bacterium]|nr:ATP-dependent Clp protease ATP-binding subunit [bacterium]
MALNNSELTEKMMAQAIDLSRAWKHHYLGLEHLFAAACRVDGSIAESLSRFGITSSDLESGILDFVPIGDPDPLWDGMPETPRYRRLMKSTVFEEAESCRALRLEPKHIVTAILREGRSVPCRYLRLKNVDLLTLRDDILGRRVGSQATPSPLPTAPPEDAQPYGQSPAGGANQDGKNPKGVKMLLQFGRDMVEMARQGKIDPVIGRDDEVRRVLQVLTRKTKSNPVLVGEAGVGKTAVAYGLALRIAAGTVPEALRDKRLIDLSLTSLVAGTGHRGEFEKRLQDIMKEAQSDSSIILFIDEIHQIVGAGDSKGGMDAGNILKPALARGDLRVMGATTIDEYRKYIEADPALERRFQQVMVGEPSEEDAFEILKGVRPKYEQHHGVTYPDETLLATVKLSMRFLPDRNLPDKAIDLIDEAAARIKNRPNAPGTPEASMVVT